MHIYIYFSVVCFSLFAREFLLFQKKKAKEFLGKGTYIIYSPLNKICGQFEDEPRRNLGNKELREYKYLHQFATYADFTGSFLW